MPTTPSPVATLQRAIAHLLEAQRQIDESAKLIAALGSSERSPLLGRDQEYVTRAQGAVLYAQDRMREHVAHLIQQEQERALARVLGDSTTVAAQQEEEIDMLDRVHAMGLGLEEEHLGGGLLGLVRDGDLGTVVVTDDGDAVLIGFYPGDNWSTGEEEGNVLNTGPIDDDSALRIAIEAALKLSRESN